MSTIRAEINAQVKEAMKNKEVAKRDALRLLTSAFKQIEVDERKELTDEDVLAIIKKQIKQREDAIEQYKSAERMDLVEKEQSEIDFFMPFMPKQLDEAELKTAVAAIIEKVGASSMKDMGKVMGVANQELGSVSNGKAISAMVKQLLG